MDTPNVKAVLAVILLGKVVRDLKNIISREDMVSAITFFAEACLSHDVDREKLILKLQKSHKEIGAELDAQMGRNK